MTFVHDYEMHVLNELIVVMLESAAVYHKAAAAIEDRSEDERSSGDQLSEVSPSQLSLYRQRAAKRVEAAERLQQHVREWSGTPAASGSILAAAYSTLFGAQRDNDVVGVRAMLYDDELMRSRLVAALTDRHLSEPVVELIRWTGRQIELDKAPDGSVAR